MSIKPYFFSELEKACLERFEEIKSDYPGQEEFFEKNKKELLVGLQNCRSEKELSVISPSSETVFLRTSQSYSYLSSSMYAAEEVIITLLDSKRLLECTAIGGYLN